MKDKFPVVTLCGSTKFKDEFIKAQHDLTLAGWIVLSVGLFGHADEPSIFESGLKPMLDAQHKQKIDMSDAIYVTNVDGYIGDSTLSEIEYAKAHDKKIMYLSNEEAECSGVRC